MHRVDTSCLPRCRMLALTASSDQRFLCLIRKRSVLELAIQQSGNAASKTAAEDASGSGKEGSSAGILKVVICAQDSHQNPVSCLCIGVEYSVDILERHWNPFVAKMNVQSGGFPSTSCPEATGCEGQERHVR